MAGGQERILRGRIRSIQATKKITRAMELIRRVADRQGPATGRRRRALLGEDHRRGPRPRCRRGRDGRTAARRSRHDLDDVLRGDRRRSRPVRGLQRGCAASHRGRGRSRRAQRQAVPHRPGRSQRHRVISTSAVTTSGSRSPGSPTRPSWRTPSASPSTSSSSSPPVPSTRSSWCTPGSSRPATRRSSCVRSCHCRWRTAAGGDGRAGGADVPHGDYEYEPDPGTILDALLPSYVEARVYAALLNAAASEHAFRQRAMKSATDNAEELVEVLESDHESGPPGFDHHRDHGDRRRR